MSHLSSGLAPNTVEGSKEETIKSSFDMLLIAFSASHLATA